MFSSSQCDYGPVSLVLALPMLYTIISPLSCSAYPLSLPTHLRGVYVPRSSIYSLPDFSLNHSGNKLKAYIASIDFPVLVLVISNLSLMLQDPHLPLWCFHAHLQTTLSFHSLKWVFFFLPHSSPTPTPASITLLISVTTGFSNFAFSLSPNHELQ